MLKDHHVSRISINPQTMNQKTLDLIGRRHTVEETKAAFFMAREMGFDNINMDLIVGLPGEEKEDVEQTLKEVIRLDPDSITVHSLAVKRAARLSMFKDQYKEMTFTNNMEIMNMTAQYAADAGMFPVSYTHLAQVKVLETKDRWFGVTYKEDKQVVVDSFRRLIEEGVYRSPLF